MVDNHFDNLQCYSLVFHLIEVIFEIFLISFSGPIILIYTKINVLSTKCMLNDNKTS